MGLGIKTDSMQIALVRQNWRRVDERASVDPGPKDRQHHAVPPGFQELEHIPDVLRRFRPATAWGTTAAQDPHPHAQERRQEALAQAPGPEVEAGGSPAGRHLRGYK